MEEMREDLLKEIKKNELEIRGNIQKIKRCQLEFNKINKEIRERQLEIKNLKSKINQLPIGINKLSHECMQLIFYNLNFKDLIQCNETCKKWNQIVLSLNFKGAVLDFKNPSFEWFYKSKEDRILTIDGCNFNLLKSIFCRLFLGPNLKEFKVEGIPFNIINKLCNLEILEIREFYSKESKFISVDLPFLKSLAFHGHCEDSIEEIELNTLNLSSFYIKADFWTKIKFNCPEKLKHVFLNSYHRKIEKFKNLETMSFQLFLGDMNIDLLNLFPNLKQMSFKNTISSMFSNMAILDLLLERRKFLERVDLKLIYNGVEIEDANQLNACNIEEFLMKNYSKIVDRQKITRMNYSLFNKYFDKVPDDLGHKLNFDYIFIEDKIDDEEKLIQFLEKLNSLRYLSIQNSSLSSVFWNYLSNSHSNFRALIINKNTVPIDNFQFIRKFEDILIDEEVPLHAIWEAIEERNRFEISFKYKKENVTIRKQNSKCFLELSISRKHSSHTFETLNELEDILKNKFSCLN